MGKRILRSVSAVLLGYVVTAALVIGGFTTIGVVAPEALPAGAAERASTAVLVTILALGVFQAAVGGYVTAVVGKRAPLLHAVALAGLIFALSTISFFTSNETQYQPSWYNAGLVAVGVLGALAGGEVRAAQLHHRLKREDGEPSARKPESHLSKG